jgi:hypothetical protein
MDTPQILTLNEVADFLGVGAAAVAAWARDGILPACARSEGGELLFYRWRVERDGPKFAANELVRFRKASSRRSVTVLHDGRRLPCGCVLADHEDGTEQPVWLCPDVRVLQAVDRLAAAFVAAAPNDPFFRHLARVTAEALKRHFAAVSTKRDSKGVSDHRVSRYQESASLSETGEVA